MHPCCPLSESLHAPVLRHPANTCPGAPGEPRSTAWPCSVSGWHPSQVAELGCGELGGLQPCGQSGDSGKVLSSLGTCPGKHALQKVTGMVILKNLNDDIGDLSSVLKYFCLLKKHFPTLFHYISFLLLFLGSPVLNLW